MSIEDHGRHGEDFDDFVLLDVDEAQNGVQHEVHVAGKKVGV